MCNSLISTYWTFLLTLNFPSLRVAPKVTICYPWHFSQPSPCLQIERRKKRKTRLA